ncbi:MAG: hypothetical protein HQL94_06420 [Magnetococcales bacterium]|nr:hypothetical protein [Magnetococcales bacterium]MBF0439343.1 hypothetical protein [Magnetococcales bacterium]
MVTGSPLIHAWRFNGAGGGTSLTWSDIHMTSAAKQQPFWLHMNRNSETASQWIQNNSEVDTNAVKALLASETRPRCTRFKEGAVLLLRSVNENKGHDFHDMVALRLWVDASGIVSLRGRRMFFIDEIYRALKEGNGPKTPVELLVILLERLTFRMEPILEHMRSQLEELETNILEGRDPFDARRDGPQIRQQLGRLRVAAVAMRRYLSPQKEAITRLMNEEFAWIGMEHKSRLLEVVNETTRHMEDLDEIRDTAGIIQDSVANSITEGLNDLLFKLTMMSAFFMPLSFVVGWFGSNVSGLYLNADSAWFPTQHGFTLEGLLLVAIGLIEVWVFKKLKWL